MNRQTLLLALAILAIVIGGALAAGWKPFGSASPSPHVVQNIAWMANA